MYVSREVPHWKYAVVTWTLGSHSSINSLCLLVIVNSYLYDGSLTELYLEFIHFLFHNFVLFTLLQTS